MAVPKEVTREEYCRLASEPHVTFHSYPCIANEYVIKPTYRPWRAEEVPVGAVVKAKICDAKRLIVAVTDNLVSLGGHVATVKVQLNDLFDSYTLADGSPCGVKE